jgi:hypothetical protein
LGLDLSDLSFSLFCNFRSQFNNIGRAGPATNPRTSPMQNVSSNHSKNFHMPKNFLFFLVILLSNSCISSGNDGEQIKECFSKYKSAILTKDGNKGIECVDSATINFYSTTLHKSIEFDSLQIENEPAIEKLTILKVRQNFPEDSIMQMDGTSLLKSLINKGLAGNSNIAKYELGNAKIDNDSAIVEKIIEGKRTVFVFRFNKEKSVWRLSTFSAREHEIYNLGIQQSILKSKLSEHNFIIDFIETTSGMKLKENIWHPLKTK